MGVRCRFLLSDDDAVVLLLSDSDGGGFGVGGCGYDGSTGVLG